MRIGDPLLLPDGDTWRLVHFHEEPNTGLCTLERQDITRFRITLPVSWLEAIIGNRIAESSDFDTACERAAFVKGMLAGRVAERDDVAAYGARTLGHNYWFVQEVRNSDHVGAAQEVSET